ncbi:hypothetical protein J1N35_036521 [Gossypium stocksii]|uniref:DUF674 domain-containing protein n=1 Tax=Gossypium stocksii TaxID=47602 RepID=A0A9D3ZKW8_9ROSI|nr:hypothetical protein J1N35_036521 [Gossypium stocksii]
MCGNNYRRSNCGFYVSDDSESICPSCNNVMTQTATIVNPRKGSSTNKGGYVKGIVTYMITDDLVGTPMSAISCFTLLNKFNIKDVGVLEEKTINIGIAEGVKLLKASLQSKTVLTDAFLQKKARESSIKSLMIRWKLIQMKQLHLELRAVYAYFWRLNFFIGMVLEIGHPCCCYFLLIAYGLQDVLSTEAMKKETPFDEQMFGTKDWDSQVCKSDLL